MARSCTPWTPESVITQVQALGEARRRRLREAHLEEQAKVVDGKTVVCISDTHGRMPADVPHGDILIHAGDLTSKCTQQKLQAQLDWINSLPHTHKVCIAGNHDLWLDPDQWEDKRLLRISTTPLSTARTNLPSPNFDASARFPANKLDWGAIHYLLDSAVVLNFKDGTKLTIYGSPRTTRFGTPGFQYDPSCHDPWSSIPSCDILVTHGPAKLYCDGLNGNHFGDAQLLQALWRVRPKLFVHGHIHESAGREVLVWDAFQRSYEHAMSGKWAGLPLSDLLVSMIAMIWLSLTSKMGEWCDRTIVINAALGRGSPFIEKVST